MTEIAKPTVLVVDDEKSILEALSDTLRDDGYEVINASSGEEALTLVKEQPPELILLDVWMSPGIDGLETLKAIKEIAPEPIVIMISGHGNVDIAVQATKLGAYDFLEKPLSGEKVLILLKRALEKQTLEKENIALKTSISKSFEIVGESPGIKALKTEIAKTAISQSRV